MGWIIAFLICFSTLAYQRAALRVWAVALATFLILMTWLNESSPWKTFGAWVTFLIIFIPLYATTFRQKFVTQHILNFYRKIMPSMSRTEREALAAGTVGWEGELFLGRPQWEKLLVIPKAQLSEEEQAFLDGPVETLCSMIDDWNITHYRLDMPPALWEFIKEQGFFGLIIPKKFGGKAFSAYAHSQVLTKVYSRSGTVASTIAVPNSLGPAELLLHYGTPEQQNYYLPRLARGEEVPCFALTEPEAGSDAGAMTSSGIVCWGELEGKKVLGIRLNWNKRYITLAPVATVIGLAFKLYDPEQLLGENKNLGITCALIPRHTPGITIGRRHFLSNTVFQNGPIHGKDVFIPVEWVIGGPTMAGQGWRMLMECLAAGRAISLPASAIGGAKVASYVVGAYARIRRQFNTPIGHFEGIESVIARIAGHTYIMDATRTFTAAIIDSGEKPAVASAITKYHVTELGRLVCNDTLDVHGGKGICMGPKNYLGRFYQSVPIAITVEGANILTRSMIIFGQGAMRCHPYLFAEYQAAQQENEAQRLTVFDKALLGHMGFLFSNFISTLLLSLSSGRIVKVPHSKTKYYFQQATRFSTAFAFIADISLLVLGGSLKRRENISARLGDILSYLFILSAVLKHYHDQGNNADDLPLVEWAGQLCLYHLQCSLSELLNNFPNRGLASLLKIIIFPFGKRFAKPSDALNHKVARLLQSVTPTRYRLSQGAFTTPVEGNMVGKIEDALRKTIAAESIEKIIRKAMQDGIIQGDNKIEQAKLAFAQHLISKTQLETFLQAEEARSQIIAVDDFAPEELFYTNAVQDTAQIYALHPAKN